MQHEYSVKVKTRIKIRIRIQQKKLDFILVKINKIILLNIKSTQQYYSTEDPNDKIKQNVLKTFLINRIMLNGTFLSEK